MPPKVRTMYHNPLHTTNPRPPNTSPYVPLSASRHEHTPPPLSPSVVCGHGPVHADRANADRVRLGCPVPAVFRVGRRVRRGAMPRHYAVAIGRIRQTVLRGAAAESRSPTRLDGTLRKKFTATQKLKKKVRNRNRHHLSELVSGNDHRDRQAYGIDKTLRLDCRLRALRAGFRGLGVGCGCVRSCTMSHAKPGNACGVRGVLMRRSGVVVAVSTVAWVGFERSVCPI